MDYLESEARKSEIKAGLLFDDHIGKGSLRSDDIISAFSNDSRLVKVNETDIIGQSIHHVFVKSGAISSKCGSCCLFLSTLSDCINIFMLAQARKLCQSGGLYLNKRKLSSIDQIIQSSDLLDSRILLLQTGKSNFTILAITGGV